jgi:hypothetical protein
MMNGPPCLNLTIFPTLACSVFPWQWRNHNPYPPITLVATKEGIALEYAHHAHWLQQLKELEANDDIDILWIGIDLITKEGYHQILDSLE